MTHWIWEDAKAFQRWICLLMFAAWEDTEMKYHNKRVKVNRGQLVTSKRQLARRWHTNSRIVKNLLQDFIYYEMITVEVKDNMTFITILNYEKYQYANDEKGKFLKVPVNTKDGQEDEKYSSDDQNRLQKRSQDIINNNKLNNDFTPEVRALEIKYFEKLYESEKIFTDETLQILEVTQEEIPLLLEKFKEEQLRRQKKHNNINDYLRHFHDWLNKMKENGKRNTKNKRNTAGRKAKNKTQPTNYGGDQKIPREDGAENNATRGNGETGKQDEENPFGRVKIRKTKTDD